MRQLLALLFIIIIGVQAVHQGLIYTYYTLNKTYITQHFCENKAKPALKCNGKCHLKEVLSIATKEKKTEKTPIPNLEEIKAPVLFFQAIKQTNTLLYIYQPIATQSKVVFNYFFQYSCQTIRTIFKPPQT